MKTGRKKVEFRADGTWFHTNVKPSRQTAHRKAREAAALDARRARKQAHKTQEKAA